MVPGNYLKNEGKIPNNSNSYQKGLDAAQAGQYEQALCFMQEHLHTAGEDAQVLNDTGAILHCLGRSEEAIAYFLKARRLNSESAEILWNLTETYLATGRAKEASCLFDDMKRMEILNVDVLNRTANVFLNQNNKAGAVEMLLQSLYICPKQEILIPMLSVIKSKRPKIAFFCGGDGMNFLNEIYEFAKQRFEVRLFDGRTEDQLYELMKWSDISWFEWCTNLAVIGSRKPKVCENIIRLHRYEAYEQWPREVNWSNIDLLITVGNSFVKNALIQSVPEIENQTSLVTIPSGVNLERFTFIDKPRGKNIAFLSNLRLVKNPAMILQCMQKLHYIDPEYKLFFAGQFQDGSLEQYLRYMVNTLGLQDVVFFDNWQRDVHVWLKDKHYAASTSIIESQGMGILEAMACGLKPVIHNFPGASEIFRPEYVFNISEEFCQHVLSESYEPQQYRRFVEEKYPLKKQLAEINNIFIQLEAKLESKHIGKMSHSFPQTDGRKQFSIAPELSLSNIS
ncbi:MAG: glycosyltransferase [Sedimentisphaerales bacterium]|nr:glycosyltransferase [Sedimentisphaerales bacterium]